MNTVKKTRERGNVLFLILIAVVLFAGLGFAVSNILQSGNPTTIAGEQARVYAGEILDYGRNLRQAVQSMRISNGCRDTEISFENSVITGYVNGTNTACQVFDSAGGGMNYVVPAPQFFDSQFSSEIFYGEWFFTGEACLQNVGSTSTNCHTDGIDNSELIAFLPYLNKGICLSINDSLDIDNPSDDARIDPNSFWAAAPTRFQGVYSETGRAIDGGTIGSDIAFCVKSEGTNPADDSYTFVQVLIAR